MLWLCRSNAKLVLKAKKLSMVHLHLQVPVTHTPASKPFQPTRRASLPLSTRATTFESPYNPNGGLLSSVRSPDVSVNAPRIDRVIEFPIASSEEPMFSIYRPSSTSAHCCTTSPTSGDRSITKDKCIVQILDRTFAKPYKADANRVAPRSGSECSEQNPTTVVSSRSSSDSRQRRFATSSYQQRAEALEGLLEFSAQLLQQERFNELGVLLKPFGPGKVVMLKMKSSHVAGIITPEKRCKPFECVISSHIDMGAYY
ncbi:hypothetical protein TEA_020932 [Camellia sinensis var. sinensis]|uniref:Uncharacterized protein n=1 Tax=Camellia sinensis var. sinensis TaxID=542762 RepID=A0A4S4D3B9_CAMSN|nr:hypothetical protein TEA_020932 [Camellia sinensis var. sinensis]